jgi:hypothetical protein
MIFYLFLSLFGFTEVVTKGGNRIGEVMASMLASSVVDRGFEPHRVKPKNIKLAFVALDQHA